MINDKFAIRDEKWIVVILNEKGIGVSDTKFH